MTRLTGDVLRVVATLAVVMIHGTSFSQEPFRLQHDFASADFVAVVIGQSLRFCVPIFLILSGYGLTLRYGTAAGGVNLREFLGSRASKILIPFLVWTIAMLLFAGRLDPAFRAVSPGEGLAFAGSAYLRALLLGNGDYHLYFFSIILQCYLLFPLLVRLPAWPMFALSAGVQLAFASPLSGWLYRQGIFLPALPSPVCVYWLAYFQLGIVSARYAAGLTPAARVVRIPLLLGCLAALFWLLVDYVQRSYSGQPTGSYDHFNRLSVIVFSLLVWATTIAWDDWISETVNRSPRVREAIYSLAAVSFTVYLIHPNLLRLLRLAPLPILLLNLVLVVLAVAVALGLLAVARPNLLRVVLGLPGRKP